jgi:tRNA (guanine37-N1)-methyltransferase
MMKFAVITLLPELVEAVVASGVTSRAVDKGLMQVQCINPRKYATDKHRTIDDRPYGGGPGMVMRADTLLPAIREAKQHLPNSKVVYLSPQGKRVNQSLLQATAKEEGLILLCGRYEGIDERVITLEVDEEWSLGDYVLSGGELGAMVVIDGITRLLPNVLGHHESAVQDSFTDGLLDCPHFTRPETVEGLTIPTILKSGNHAKIARWRRTQALGRTAARRPELLDKLQLSEQDESLLEEFIQCQD